LTRLSVHERVAAARHRLREAGLSPAEADVSARALAEHVLGWSTERFFTDAFGAEPDGFDASYRAAVERRAAREPLPYITGEREFWGLMFEVTPDVLIPRPETEIIVEAALEIKADRDRPIAVADACTGSGCIGIAIAAERPRASIVATDISAAALAVARRNAVRHGVAERTRFVQTDLLQNVAGPFDLVVANPPYVRAGDRPGLQPEVREEPDVALYGGPEGLDAITRLVGEAPACLKNGGYLIFEFGLGQDMEIERLVGASASLTLVELRRDLQGIARTAVARRG
jgi:release factor glutamine methyltransferase